MKNQFERLTFWRPAFDKRHTDPTKNYGIGSMSCRMVLKGERGAVQFYFSTGMLLPETIEEYIKNGRAEYEITPYGHHFLNKPMGYDVGYHSLKPQYDGQQSRECGLLKGGKCYYDGSGLRAEEWFDIFLRKGDDKIWQMLEDDYKKRFN